MKIVFPIKPEAWQRVSRNKAGFAYVPPKTAKYKQQIAFIAKCHMKGLAPYSGPLHIVLIFFLPQPKSSKRMYPDVRPDLDNFCKVIFDAGNGILWKDDAQICLITASKQYTTLEPRVELRLSNEI